MTELLKKGRKFEWGEAQQKSYEKLKSLIQTAPMLKLLDERKPLILSTDASGFAVGAVLSQPSDDGSVLRPLAFYSAKLKNAETRYATHEREMLAIVKALKFFRCYIHGRPTTVLTDHRTLQYFQVQDKYSARQERWNEFLQQYNLIIKYQAGKSNVVADFFSRRPDLDKSSEETVIIPKSESPIQHTFNGIRVSLEGTVSVSKKLPSVEIEDVTHEEYGTPISVKDHAQPTQSTPDKPNRVQLDSVLMKIDPIQELKEKVKLAQAVDDECRKMMEQPERIGAQFKAKVQNGVLYEGERLYVPNNQELRAEILQRYHNHPLSGHIGGKKTIELINREYYWMNLYRDVYDYVASCASCQRAKSRQQKSAGTLFPLPIPNRPWESISIDLITQLPKSKTGYDCIIVVVDRLTKYCHCFPAHTKINAPELARLFFQRIVTLHGLPASIISDRDPRFTSLFWREIMRLTGLKQNMSSGYHPETDGQTERMNRTLEDILRNYINFKQNDWDEILPYAEIAINNSEATSTGKTPFFANYHFHPNIQSIQPASDPEVPAASEFNNQIAETIKDIKIRIQSAQQRQAAYANRRRSEIEFAEGEEVWLSTRNLPVQIGSRKFVDKFIGPFKIIEKISRVAYRLQLPSHMRIYNVFHISQLTGYRTTRYISNPVIDRPPPVFKENKALSDEWEIDEILNHRIRRRRRQYLVHWKGYGFEENSWLDESRLNNAQELLKEYWREQSLCQLDLNALKNRKHQSEDRIVETIQCEAITRKRRQCKLKTKKGNKCWIHLSMDENLRIRPSQIERAGLGVYADKAPFQRGQKIVEYTGKIQATNGTDFALQISKNKIINAAQSRNTGSYINDCRTKNRQQGECPGVNARFVVDRRAGKVNIKATKRIRPGSEIYVPYGAAYWRDKEKYDTWVAEQRAMEEQRKKQHIRAILNKYYG